MRIEISARFSVNFQFRAEVKKVTSRAENPSARLGLITRVKKLMDILTIITGESWFIAPKSRGSKSRRNCNTALSPLRQKLFGKNVTQLCID